MTFPGTSQPVLRHLNLTVKHGEFLTIVGPSGCGKSTVLRLIAGLLSPTAGTVQLAAAQTTGQLRPAREPGVPAFGFVFQQPTLLPWRTARQNLLLPLQLENSSASVSDQDVINMLQRVGLRQSDADKRPAELSGGMQMRLSLARALMINPDILLLDEPLAAVDDLLRMRLQEDIRRLHQELKLTTVLVTHNLSEAVFLSDRVVVLAGQPACLVSELTVSVSQARDAEFRQSIQCHNFINQLTSSMVASVQP